MSSVKVGIFIEFGQSNELGVDTGSMPVGIPDASILYNYWNYLGNDFTSFQALQADPLVPGAHGPELSCGLALKALGAFDVVVICKVAKGATTISDWRPGGPEGLSDALNRKATECRDWVEALYPGCEKRYYLSSAIGETDAANPTPPTLWAENFLLTRQSLETALGLRTPLKPIITLTNAQQTSNQNLAIVRSEQADAAFQLVSMDDIYPSDGGGGLHYTAAQCNTHGTRRAAKLVRAIYMAVTHPTSVRNSIADLVVTGVDSLVIRQGSTVLATVTLAGFAAASGGTAALSSTPRAFTGTASGTADNYLAQASGVTRFQGSVTATGGGGDLTLDSTAIVNGGTGSITGGGYTAPP